METSIYNNVGGKRLKNGKTSHYDLSIFGDWVRYQREEVLGWTLARAAEAYNENVGDGTVPMTGPNWRTLYERLGYFTPATDRSHQRHKPVMRHHCRKVAATLGLPLSEVEMQAGFIPTDNDTTVESDVLAQTLRNIDDGSYAKWIAYGKELREEQKREARQEQEAQGNEETYLVVQVTSLAEKCLQIQAHRQGMTLVEYAQSTLERQSRIMDPYDLRKLPREERNRLMAQQAEEAAPLYEADLARPVAERELTAFTALEGEPVYDDTP